MSVGLRLIDDDGIQQAFSAHELNDGALDFLQAPSEELTQLLRALDHVFVPNDLHGPDGDSRTERISSICRAVRARFHCEHDILTTQHAGHGIHASRDRFTQKHQIRLDATPLVAQQLAGTGNSGLDFIADQQGIVLVAERPCFLQIVVVRNDDPGLALDRLHEECRQVRARLLES